MSKPVVLKLKAPTIFKFEFANFSNLAVHYNECIIFLYLVILENNVSKFEILKIDVEV